MRSPPVARRAKEGAVYKNSKNLTMISDFSNIQVALTIGTVSASRGSPLDPVV